MKPKTKQILPYIPAGVIVGGIVYIFASTTAQGAIMVADLPEDKEYYNAWVNRWMGIGIAIALTPPAALVYTLITN